MKKTKKNTSVTIWLAEYNALKKLIFLNEKQKERLRELSILLANSL